MDEKNFVLSVRGLPSGPDEPLGHCAVPVRHGARHPRLKAKLAARLRFAWPTASGYAYCRCGLSLAVMPPTSRAVCPRVKPRLHLRQRLLCLDSLRLSETRHSASTRRDPASMPTIVNFVSTCQAEAVALGQEELRSHARGKPRVLAGQAKWLARIKDKGKAPQDTNAQFVPGPRN